ncbi:hypothetical protein UFOVP1545_5 [uncultured Caudovirales phage]|uniref:Uncharacterized protein n=1 Tax=uncultured Caudovirales phage TaxID=2100421 RepID=A0A6J7XCM9_9CAUD|nr:hypothetical protein UFOVP1545_5 [uncultured Caudovirales phage]
MDTQESAEPTEEKVDRRDLLSEQFDEIGSESPEPVIQTEAAEEPEEEPIWAKPPSSWKREYHEPWQSVDPKVREYVWQREEEVRSGIEPMKTKAQFADQVNKAMEPYMPTIQGLGIDAPTAIQALMQADYTLRNSPPDQKRAYLVQLASQYGINLGDEGYDQQVNPIDPAIYELRNELNSVRGEVVGWKKQQEEVQNQTLLSEIEQFAHKADFFEDARPTMIQLLNAGVATDLQDAYEKAIRLDPDLSEQVQQSRQAEADAAKSKAANKAAKSAKAAAVSVRTSTPGFQPTTKAQDRRSMLLEQFDSVSERF